MLRNTQISHILLLCVIALVIYQLCKPKNIKNEGTLEPITNHQKDEQNVDETKSDSDIDMTGGVVTENEVEASLVEPAPSVTDPNKFVEMVTEGGASIDDAYDKPLENADELAIDFNKNMVTEFDSKDYLPDQTVDNWFDTDFSMAKFVESDKLINVDKYVIGVDTVGQSLKNASYDLRGTVANPKYNVSPWMNSTYEADYNIKPLC